MGVEHFRVDLNESFYFKPVCYFLGGQAPNITWALYCMLAFSSSLFVTPMLNMLFVTFGIVIEDSLGYLRSEFCVRYSDTLAPPPGQMRTSICNNNSHCKIWETQHQIVILLFVELLEDAESKKKNVCDLPNRKSAILLFLQQILPSYDDIWTELVSWIVVIRDSFSWSHKQIKWWWWCQTGN